MCRSYLESSKWDLAAASLEVSVVLGSAVLVRVVLRIEFALSSWVGLIDLFFIQLYKDLKEKSNKVYPFLVRIWCYSRRLLS